MNYYKSISLWVIRIGLWIVPFIPLYISQSLFFPYITGKAFLFRTIVEIVFVFWVFLAIFYPEYRPRKSFLWSAVIFFLLAATVATIFSENVLKSFWSNFERMEGLVAYIHLVAYFVVLSSVFKKRDWFIFLNLFIVAGLLENAYGLMQWFGYFPSPQGGSRIDGTIGNPTYLAAYFLFIASFCALLLFENKNKLARYFYGAAFAWTLLSIYFTASRGPVIALLIGTVLGVLIFLMLREAPTPREKLFKKVVLSLLVVLIVFVASVWLLRNTTLIQGTNPNYQPPLARLTSLSFGERTITSRFTIWKMGWEGFLEHPFLGWGPDNYGLVFAKYYKPELWAQEPWFDRSHNIVLDWLVNGGVVGFVGYFGMLAAAIFTIVTSVRKKVVTFGEGLLIAMTLLVYLIQDLFVFDNIATYIGLFTILAYLENFSRTSGNPSHEEVRGRSLSYQPLALCTLLVIGGFSLYTINGKALETNLNLLDALRFQSQDPSAAFDSFQKALAGGFLGRTEVREQFIQFAMSAGQSNIDSQRKDTILRRGEEEAQKNVAENSKDPRSYLFLGGLYARLSVADSNLQNQIFDKSLNVFNDALKLSPAKQQIYFEIADVYLKKGDYVRAIDTMQKAYDLDPQFGLAQMNLVAVLILHGDQNTADTLLIKHRGTVDVPEQLLVQVYSRLVDNYRADKNSQKAAFYADRLIRVRQAFVKYDPNTFDEYRQLSLVYLVLGDTSHASQVLQAALAAHPEWKGDIDAFVQQVQAQGKK